MNKNKDVRQPHGLTWDEWRFQTTSREEEGFLEFAYRHWDQGNPPAWADWCWKKQKKKQQ